MMMMVIAVSLVVSITLVGSGLFLLFCYNQRNNSYSESVRLKQQEKREELFHKQQENKQKQLEKREREQEEQEHEEKMDMKKLFLSSLENRIRGGDAEAYHVWMREKNKP